MKYLTMAVAIFAIFFVNSAEARRGSCDGIHGCTCGSTQTRHFGLPRVYNGHNLWRAVEWKRAFPRTSARPGVIVYQHGGGPSGHVSRIDSMLTVCKAIVTDEKGTYERNICARGAIYLDPSGAHTFSARSFN